MYSNGKTILRHNANDFRCKNIVKNKISVICQIAWFLAAILIICKLGHEDVIFQFANIGFRIQRTKLPQIKVSNPFLHKMPLLVNFSDFFPDYHAGFWQV